MIYVTEADGHWRFRSRRASEESLLCRLPDVTMKHVETCLIRLHKVPVLKERRSEKTNNLLELYVELTDGIRAQIAEGWCEPYCRGGDSSVLDLLPEVAVVAHLGELVGLADPSSPVQLSFAF